MKKLVLTLLFGIIFLCLDAQEKQIQQQYVHKSNHSYNFKEKQSYFIPSPDTIQLLNITIKKQKELNGWAQDGSSCLNCPSYFYKIVRSKIPYKAEDNIYYYYYYFYFFSNSYNRSGESIATSLTDIAFYGGSELIFKIPYILIEPNVITYGAWLRSKKPDLIAEFKIKNVSVFNIK